LFVVEDDSLDLAARLCDPFGLGLINAVEGRVVGKLAGLDEAGVELLELVVS
jgi:hypothetical protein